MDQIDNQQIDKLLNDISTIKNVLSRNRGLLQKMLLPAHFRILWYACGFGFIFFCLLFYFLVQYFDTYGDIPLLFKAVIYIAIVLYLFFMVYIKWSTLLSSAKQIHPKMTFGRVLKEFFIFRVRHIVFPIVLLYTFFIVFFICIGKAYYIIPTILMAISLMFNFFGSITGIRQYLIAGYWFLITGILSVIFNAIPPWIVIAVSFGCGLLVFAVSTSFSTGVDMEV